LTVGFSRHGDKDCPVLLCVVCNAAVDIACQMQLHTDTKSLYLHAVWRCLEVKWIKILQKFYFLSTEFKGQDLSWHIQGDVCR